MPRDFTGIGRERASSVWDSVSGHITQRQRRLARPSPHAGKLMMYGRSIGLEKLHVHVLAKFM